MDAPRFSGLPFSQSDWDALVDEATAIATEYREDGWQVIKLHPGDVAPGVVATGHEGFTVLLPRNEFDDLYDAIECENARFSEFEVYHASVDGCALLLVLSLDHSQQVAVVTPLYYTSEGTMDLLRSARERGRVDTLFLPLSEAETVCISYDRPDLFFPPDAEE